MTATRAELESGVIDLTIAGYFSDLPEGYYRQKIFSDVYRSAVRLGHPSLKQGKLSLHVYAAAEHVLISPQGDLKAMMDEELRKRGLKRRMVAGMSGFLSSALIAAETDLVLTALGRDLEALARYVPLKIFPTPLPLPPVHTTQVWHDRRIGARCTVGFELPWRTLQVLCRKKSAIKEADAGSLTIFLRAAFYSLDRHA